MVTGNRGKDRKEKNLASGSDSVARGSHRHGSSGALLVCNFYVCRWWGSPCCLVARPFVRCSGRLFPRQWHIPHVLPFPCMAFSVLALAGCGGGQCPDTFSTATHPSSNSFRGWFQVAFYSLSGLYLAGPPGGPTVSWAAKKLCWSPRRSCSKLCKQALRQLS